jgi:probable F420-dependent oxidoreductase
MLMPRIGTNLPLQGVPLCEHRAVLARLREAGFTDAWSNEYARGDAAVPLAAFASWDDSVNLVSGIVNIATRGPALLAMTLAGLADLAPGRMTIGLGTSSVVPVAQWNGMAAEQPYTRMRETLEFLDVVLSGARDRDNDYQVIRTDGFQLADLPDTLPRIGVAALGPRMQRLAASHADTLITGFLAASDLDRVRANTAEVERTRSLPFEILVGVFVLPPMPSEQAERDARRCIAQYFNTPPYAAQQRWLGRADELTPMWEAWSSGDRRGAVAAIPDDLVGEMIVHGSVTECAARIRKYFDAGATGLNLMVAPTSTPVPAEEQIAFLCELASELRASG